MTSKTRVTPLPYESPRPCTMSLHDGAEEVGMERGDVRNLSIQTQAKSKLKIKKKTKTETENENERKVQE